MIIAIEGGDACGKATQSKILAERLHATHFSFPDYKTPAGRAILSNLKTEWGAIWVNDPDNWSAENKHTNALVLQSLMLTNRMERGADLRAAARSGNVVLDRYDASAIVYGTLDGLDPTWLRETNRQLPVRPDLYLLLDAPVDEGFRRRPERRDRYEKDRPFLERVREGYLRLFAEEQDRLAEALVGLHGMRDSGTRWYTIDAVGTIDEVALRVWGAAVAAGA